MAEAARLIGDATSQGIRDACSGRKRVSADLIARLAGVTNIDVLYILTGQRSTPQAAEPSAEYVVDRRRAAFLDNFDHLSEEDKKALERTAFALAQSTKKVKKKTG